MSLHNNFLFSSLFIYFRFISTVAHKIDKIVSGNERLGVKFLETMSSPS